MFVPSGVLTFKGAEYSIVDEQLVLIGNEETKIWRRRGIRNQLIEKSKTTGSSRQCRSGHRHVS
ncbi:MAG: hypothetical protein U0936_04895 [Planctomycetaceae bacterium]